MKHIVFCGFLILLAIYLENHIQVISPAMDWIAAQWLAFLGKF